MDTVFLQGSHGTRYATSFVIVGRVVKRSGWTNFIFCFTDFLLSSSDLATSKTSRMSVKLFKDSIDNYLLLINSHIGIVQYS